MQSEGMMNYKLVLSLKSAQDPTLNNTMETWTLDSSDSHSTGDSTKEESVALINNPQQ